VKENQQNTSGGTTSHGKEPDGRSCGPAVRKSDTDRTSRKYIREGWQRKKKYQASRGENEGNKGGTARENCFRSARADQRS